MGEQQEKLASSIKDLQEEVNRTWGESGIRARIC
jgi:hypothetical protein